MNLPELCIRRPVMTTLAMLAILLSGGMAYRLLPVSDLPNVDFPTIQVRASLPGANPETMAASVATPLEREFSTIAGLDSMTSTSSQGSTQITLQFSLERDIDAAAQDVQAAIAKAARRLPEDMPSPPTYSKVNPADQPIMYLALTSDVLPLSDVDEYAQTLIAQRVSMLPGVAQVQVFGSQKYAVRVQLDPRKLAAHEVGLDEVAAALREGNVNLPTGNLEGAARAYTLRAEGQLTNADAYRPLMVRYREGAALRLADLGQVLDSVENNRVASWYNHSRAIVMAIQRQPGANTVAVVDRIRQLLPSFRRHLPASVELHILNDRSQSIRESVADVKFTLILAIILVVLVIFLFLRRVSSTLIPSLALPMSLVGTFAVMHLLDYSIDNLSMMALILSVGFVVDDAIVVLENIVRHRESGKSALAAALDGSREIGFTIISMTLSLVAVFIPVLFMSGILGRLLHEFSITISVAILISGLVSLTLTPMLCSRFLTAESSRRHGWFYRGSERFFDGMFAFYKWSLGWAMRLRAVVLLLFFVTLALTGYLFVKIPKGFLPSEDTGQIFSFTEAPPGTSFASMCEHQRALADVVLSHPDVSSLSSSVTESNTGRMFIRLRPRDERRNSADEIIQQLRPRLAEVPGISAFLQNPPPIRIGGRLSKSQYQFTLQSPDTAELYHYAPLLVRRIAELPGFLDVTSDLEDKNPQVRVAIDRDKASSLGVSARQLEDALYTAYGSRQIGNMYLPNNTYAVILELLPEYQADPAVLSMLYVRSDSGRLIPLDGIAQLRTERGPLTVNHQGQLPAVTVSFNLAPGMALGDAVAAVGAVAAEVVPPSVSTSFQGMAQAFETSMRGLGLLLILAIVVIYIVLGILYESFIHPITILSGLPSAGVGALATLMLFDCELDLYGFVGIILLVGIMKKNAIMMIDFALAAQRQEGKSPEESIIQGALVRFRPIMMTTMSTMMGALPIALGHGAGAEARRPLGLAIVGGLVVSQLMTLYLTPVFYLYLEKLRHLRRRASVQAPALAGAS